MQVAREDKSLKDWLLHLAKLPDNLRETELYEMEMRMRNSKETQRYISVVESLRNKDVLSAVIETINE
jgi:hypothetical protein